MFETRIGRTRVTIFLMVVVVEDTSILFPLFFMRQDKKNPILRLMRLMTLGWYIVAFLFSSFLSGGFVSSAL